MKSDKSEVCLPAKVGMVIYWMGLVIHVHCSQLLMLFLQENADSLPQDIDTNVEDNEAKEWTPQSLNLLYVSGHYRTLVTITWLAALANL